MQKPTASTRLAMREYPKGLKPLMTQKWRDLLFLHWEHDAKEIQKTLPKGLHVDLFQGKAYIGVTPFFMQDVALKLLFPLPGVSDFLELNVRTYVYDEAGVPGVWFYSLDANSSLAVQMASSFFYLPYFYAEMEAQRQKNEIIYRSQRSQTKLWNEFAYQGTGKPREAEPNSLEFFLLERYALFVDKGDNHIAMGRIHHKPYPIYDAKVSKWDDRVIELDGLTRPGRAPDHMHFSSGVDVDIFSLQD
jgi:uncharacterized protein YqjF (DUF2071 family)